MDIEFGNLKREELKAAVTLAARAYRNYAYVALYFPDDEERFRSLHAFMNCVMKSNFGKADLLAARQQGRLVGRATLESPDFQPPSLWESFINDGWKVYLVANWKNVNGYLAMDEGACKPCHDYQKTNRGVWYLSMFEVEPDFQGKASAPSSWHFRRTMSANGVAARWFSSQTRKIILPSIPSEATKYFMSAKLSTTDEKSVVGV